MKEKEEQLSIVTTKKIYSRNGTRMEWKTIDEKEQEKEHGSTLLTHISNTHIHTSTWAQAPKLTGMGKLSLWIR